MVLTRAPLEPIGMNAAGSSKRRSARLSSEGPGENEPPTKKSRSNGVQIQTVSTKEQDGDLNAMAKPRKRKGKCAGYRVLRRGTWRSCPARRTALLMERRR